MNLVGLEAALFVLAAVALVTLTRATPLKRIALLAANGAFLALFDPLAPAVFLATSLVAYGAAHLAASGARSALVWAAGTPLLLPLFLPKLSAFAESGEVGNALGTRLVLFVGASYFTLRALHFVIDARRKRELTLGLLDFLVWNSFFPTIFAGPIERADHFAKTYERLGHATAEDVRAGVVRIFHGLLKKVVLGSIALAWARPILTFEGGVYAAPSTGEAWLALYAISLYAYFDFAGYSDLAIGVARLMGIRLAENFDWPYLRASIAEFWKGWHLSLSYWIRDYLFVPMCGRSASMTRPLLAAVGSMALCGIWHAPNVGWLLWGVLHGSGLAVHQLWTTWLRKRFALKKKLMASFAWKAFGVLLTFHFVAFTWTWISIDPTRLGPSARYVKILLGFD